MRELLWVNVPGVLVRDIKLQRGKDDVACSRWQIQRWEMVASGSEKRRRRCKLAASEQDCGGDEGKENVSGDMESQTSGPLISDSSSSGSLKAFPPTVSHQKFENHGNRKYRRCGSSSSSAKSKEVGKELREVVELLRNGRRKKGWKAFEKIEHMISWGEFHRVFESLCRHSVDDAQKMLDRMKSKGFRPSPRILQSLLKAYSAGRRLDQVDVVFESLKTSVDPVETFHYNMVINAHGECGHLTRVEELVAEMRARCVAQDQYTFNTLVKIYGKHNQMEKIYAAMDEMRSSGIAPDTVTYNTLMFSLARNGAYKAAEEANEDRKKCGVPADVVTFNTLMKLFCRQNDLARVVSTFNELRAARIKPQLVTYTILIDTFAKHGQIEAAEMAYTTMQGQKDIVPNMVLFNTLLNMYGTRGELEAMDRILVDMENASAPGVGPDSTTFNIRIDALGRKGNLAGARNAFNEMRSKNLKPDTATFNSLMKSHARNGDITGVRQWYEEMNRLDIRPDTFTLGILIDSYGKEGNVEEAERAFFILKGEGVPVDIVVFNSMLCLYSSTGSMSQVLSILEEMKDMKVSWDIYTFNIVIEAWRKFAEYDLAWNTVNELVESGIQPDPRTRSILARLMSSTDSNDDADLNQNRQRVLSKLDHRGQSH